MRTIVSFISLTDELNNKITQHAPGFIIKECSPADVTVNEIADAEIILTWSDMLPASLEQTIKLRWIQAWLAGVDRLPLDRLKAQNIYLTTASSANVVGIAEQVLGYMLVFTRKLDQAMQNKANCIWEIPKGLTEIQDKTIAIIGAGHIGNEIAAYAKAFGMKTIGARRRPKESALLDRLYLQNNLTDAVKEAEFVVNCLPLTDKTEKIIDATTFKAMKKETVYISVGRGKTTDNDALLNALKTQEIAAAALDVYETEPLPKDHPFWTMDNIFMTPHSAGQTNRYDERIIGIFIENLGPYLRGEKRVRNLVDYAEAY